MCLGDRRTAHPVQGLSRVLRRQAPCKPCGDVIRRPGGTCVTAAQACAPWSRPCVTPRCGCVCPTLRAKHAIWRVVGKKRRGLTGWGKARGGGGDASNCLDCRLSLALDQHARICLSLTMISSPPRRMFSQTKQQTTQLWMWRMEYLHHEQRPLYFGEWF